MPDKVYLEVTDETDVEELTDRLIAALFGEPFPPDSPQRQRPA